MPGIRRALGDLRNRRLLDVGCGTGALARSLARAGARVVAVDKFESMLKVARTYGEDRVSYRYADAEKDDLAIEGGRFDAVIACFVLQDCRQIGPPLRLMAANLSAHGRLVVILENDHSFEEPGEHVATRRRWLDPSSRAGKGRRQMIFWEPWFVRVAQGDSPNSWQALHDGNRSYTTITRHWSERRYIDEAREAGLELAVDGEDLLPEGDDPAIPEALFRGYIARPRIRMLVFRPAGA